MIQTHDDHPWSLHTISYILLPMYNGCDDYDECDNCIVSVKVLAVVVNVTDETEETDEMTVTYVTVEMPVGILMGVRCDS